MKLKYLFSLFMSIAAATLFAAPADGEIFNKTVSRIDKGGTFLQYLNMTPTLQKLDKLPTVVSDVMSALEIPDREMAEEVTRIVIKSLNLKVCKAIGASSIEAAPDIHILKTFAYLGDDMNTPSLFTLSPQKNSKLQWQNLPADTRIAIYSGIRTGVFFKNLKTEIAASKNPKISGIALLIDQLAQSGIDIQKLSDSVETVSIIISGSGPDTFGAVISISDTNGSITPLLAKIFPRQPGNNVVNIPIPGAKIEGLAPALVYGDRSLTLISHPKMLNSSAKKLSDVPQISKLASYLPTDGTGFFIINIDEQLISNILTTFNKNDANSPLVKKYALAPLRIVAVDFTCPDGFMTVAASNISLPQLSLEMPAFFWAGMIIPALNSARTRAKEVTCINNLKLIATALFIYADDNKNTFPAPNGQEGLNKLVTGEFISKDDLRCPLNTTNTISYIYTGGSLDISKLQNPSVYPILFDRPGLHKSGFINVAYADGHVDKFYIENYTDPAQVIGKLNKIHKYTPEIMDALLKAVAENR